MDNKEYLDRPKENPVHREIILGANRSSNYIWTLILLLGGSGFLIAGISSYLKQKLLFIFDATSLSFIPQGILLVFYGTVALSLSVFIFQCIFEQVGSGYNEYDSRDNVIRIFRKGFSFLKNDIFLVYPFSDVKSIELEIIDTINPRRVLYLCLKDGRRIPLNPTNILSDLREIENQGIFLAEFIGVSLNFKKI